MAELGPRPYAGGQGPWGLTHCKGGAEDIMAKAVFPSAKWTHWEGPPQLGVRLSAPHGLGHPTSALERSPTHSLSKGLKGHAFPLIFSPRPLS